MTGQQPRTLNIVVADDDADMRSYYERTLSVLGHRVVSSATNGCDLVDQVQQFTPDVVITDVHMPGMNGLEALDRLDREVRCIIVSAFDKPPWWEKRASRFVTYLVKPISRFDLEKAIAHAIASLMGDSS